MIRILVTILLALPLVSFAPVPHAHTVYWTRIGVSSGARVQACTFETAPAKLSAQIEDPIGYPFGFVQAWSCSGNGLAVAQELETRATAMQAEAQAYRLAHPIGGVR